LIIDVDHFKAVNDRFGHAAGDRVLTIIAAVCRSAKRDSDTVARIGGEEFAVLLPETNLEAARVVAERLRHLVMECAPTVNGEKPELTVSVGVATATLGMSGTNALLQLADEALYQAKGTGRNRVCISTAKPDTKLPQAAE
jgi:diguanylate cyclase (GGDEF)-like protein